MNNIEWEKGAVCYADGQQWFLNTEMNKKQYQLSNENLDSSASFDWFLSQRDFQLNEPRQGDYISASELSVKSVFDSAIDFFGLFGFAFEHSADAVFASIRKEQCIYTSDNGVMFYGSKNGKGRELTISMVNSIGKLKRLMNERDKVNTSENPNSCDKPKLATQYLNECIDVQKQRGEQYDSTGTGERSFAAAASAFNSLTGKNIKGSDVCLLLTCVKAVRQYSNPNRLHEDSLLDGVSYLSLWAEELNKEIN